MNPDSTAELIARLAAIRRRWFAFVALRTAARAAALASLPIAAALAVEWILRPQGVALLLLAAATALASIGLAAAVVSRMERRPDDRQVARFVEERAGRLPGAEPMDDALVSAVEITREDVAPERAAFVPLVLDAAVRRLRAVDARRLIEPVALRRAASAAAIGIFALGALIVAGLPSLERAVDTARVRFFPGSVDVQVLPGDVRLPAGSPVRIRAAVHGGADVLSRFPPSLIVSAGGDSRTVPMTRAGDAFEFHFESIDRTFTYHVTAGAARSSTYTVTALFPPRVRQIDLLYEYPAFTGLPPRHDEDGGDIYGPAGTRVRLRVHADKPIAEGALALARRPAAPVELRRAGPQVLETTLVLDRDDTYRVRLADEDGLRADDYTEYYIRLMDDRPPDVRILRPSADQTITPLEEVTIEARADDDYGIARFELVYSVSGGPERAVPFRRADGPDVQPVGTRVLAAEELGVKPGDVIAYYARAWDVGRGKRPSLAQSDIFFLEVKPFSEEFVLAESQGSGAGGGAGAQLESLIAAQKEIISATWNLERRAANGLSEADLQRVLQAQGEVRAQAEALGGRRGRGRGGVPPLLQSVEQRVPSQGRGTAGDPVGTAVAAMTRAVSELQGGRMREAIQHEMEALNGLLAAQAEVRRREVMRQAGRGGGGGGGRSSQDLSALFDRELQRQQRTTYETRNRAQDRASEQQEQESAVDRIRDLARRQEELNRRQRELEAAGSDEERRRQLERLTREQAELRAQAERLQQDLQRGSAAGGGASAEGVGQAADQMGRAAGEFRRDDSASAARSGERAADELRRMEQQLRGTGRAGARSAAELQVEARQIAREQQRIAAEAERLEAGGGATADARRRLAAEQEQLAGRVDELQRASAAQARQARGPDGQGAAEAARAIDEQQLADRMRDGARAFEKGTDADQAGAARERARAMDEVADRLGGHASAEAQRLSEQLAEANRARDRLNRLEEQLREAETRAERGGTKPGGKPEAGGQPGLEQLRAEYDRELQRAREALGRLQDAAGSTGRTPDGAQPSPAAPGNEPYKHDRSEWASLRQGIDAAIARHEAALSAELSRALADDRLNAGASERVPDAYRGSVARYYEAIARRPRR